MSEYIEGSRAKFAGFLGSRRLNGAHRIEYQAQVDGVLIKHSLETIYPIFLEFHAKVDFVVEGLK